MSLKVSLESLINPLKILSVATPLYLSSCALDVLNNEHSTSCGPVALRNFFEDYWIVRNEKQISTEIRNGSIYSGNILRQFFGFFSKRGLDITFSSEMIRVIKNILGDGYDVRHVSVDDDYLLKFPKKDTKVIGVFRNRLLFH